MTGSQEVKFHEIKLGDQKFFQLGDQQFSFFMRSKVAIMIWSPDRRTFLEIKSPKNIIFDFWSHEQFVSYQSDHEIKSFYSTGG
jgi:hypothetical protein